MSVDLQLRHLAELELDRSLSTENVDENLELELVFVDLGNFAGEVSERTFFDSNRFAQLVFETGTAAALGTL